MANFVSKYPEFYPIAKRRIASDLERLAVCKSILLPISGNALYVGQFNGTYKGNVAYSIEYSVVLDVIAIISRLYAPVPKSNPPGDDISLNAMAWQFSNNDDFLRMFKSDARRSGASTQIISSSSDLPSSVVFHMRRKWARESEQECVSGIEKSTRLISKFSKSKLYGIIRSFRSENISHNLESSKDRGRFNISNSDKLNFDKFLRASNRALLIGGFAYQVFFRHELALGGWSRYWEQYAKEFWHSAAGLEPPELQFDD
ncbi:MAG: hypothetical protein JJU26_01335 [Oceanicaulis sp.]|uniref:hypothetical protein n=1 Tax=Glycocaulis sp. TaxID=1969725 RepID=UPI0025BFCFA9|nr:hypothetical protein [Glycocaulis sp.]MCC5980338.1 hypothetical protein [Oceanicaulis sp.]MCH8521249.1 hypothetical protein [Glycocaulis sp.]